MNKAVPGHQVRAPPRAAGSAPAPSVPARTSRPSPSHCRSLSFPLSHFPSLHFALACDPLPDPLTPNARSKRGVRRGRGWAQVEECTFQQHEAYAVDVVVSTGEVRPTSARTHAHPSCSDGCGSLPAAEAWAGRRGRCAPCPRVGAARGARFGFEASSPSGLSIPPGPGGARRAATVGLRARSDSPRPPPPPPASQRLTPSRPPCPTPSSLPAAHATPPRMLTSRRPPGPRRLFVVPPRRRRRRVSRGRPNLR